MGKTACSSLLLGEMCGCDFGAINEEQELRGGNFERGVMRKSMKKTARLRPGDLVQVKTPGEILRTLDADGTVEKMPFMPEMLEHCGKTFRVSKRIIKTCAWETGSTMRAFRTNNVLLLEGLRCTGAEHDGCQKNCTIFWKEDWLRRVEQADATAGFIAQESEQLRARLKTSVDARRYFCQASEIMRATEDLSKWDRFGKCASEVRCGNCTAGEMAERIGTWVYWRMQRVLFGRFAHGTNSPTPVESLGLRAGELVEIKSLPEVSETLDRIGRNRGLTFTQDLSVHCGKQVRVERRIDKMIMDGSGEMRELHNTVYLENTLCGCAHVAFGGCGRCEYSYWREIWLRRAAEGPASGGAKKPA